MYEKFTTLKLSGGSFAENSYLKFFPNNERCSLIYGCNGTGKSTIAEAFNYLNGQITERINSACIYDENQTRIDLEHMPEKNIFVFNEEYARNNVQIKEDGLDSIVIFGELKNILDKLETKEDELKDNKNSLKKLYEQLQKIQDENSVLSPKYFYENIKSVLKEDSGWAGREKKIKNLQNKPSVNENLIESIIKTKPTELESQLLIDYNDKISKIRAISLDSEEILSQLFPILVSFNRDDVNAILGEKIEKPVLNDREKNLMNVLESKYSFNLSEIKTTFENSETTICPFCLQDITHKHKNNICKSIEKILNDVVEKHKNNLKEYIINKIHIDLSAFVFLNEEKINEMNSSIDALNFAIDKYNNIINEKIDNPYVPKKIIDDNLEICINTTNSLIDEIERARIEHNKNIKSRKHLIEELQLINKKIAYFSIKKPYDEYIRLKDFEKNIEKEIEEKEENVRKFKEEILSLKQEQKDITIALKIINDDLAYIFFSKERFSIKSGAGDKYILVSNGVSIKPRNVSAGERNVLAMSYFFSEMLNLQNKGDDFKKEMLVVIDDPISSFDMDNRIGLLSFLRKKIRAILAANPNTKIIVMSHDLMTVNDLDKIFYSFKKNQNINYAKWELTENCLKKLNYRHEYSSMLNNIYLFSMCSEEESDGLSIGNQMRRILEAYSTFTYKCGFDEMLNNDEIMSKIEDSKLIPYFENMMFKLLLNGESHMEERTKSLNDLNFFECISFREKQNIARALLSFLYLMNKQHIESHFSKDVEAIQHIENWIEEIKKGYNYD